jgi:heme oxygenase
MIEADERPSLSSVFRLETRALHSRAERTGIVSDLLRGRATRRGYAILLRNLHPAYRQLEIGLERRGGQPGLSALARPEVYRASALAADLVNLCGPDWSQRLPLLSAGRDYADRVAAAADEGTGDRLIGHAYVRYFGDLNGGQVLKRRLETTIGLPPECLSFYDFPAIDDMPTFLRSYREGLDGSALWIADQSEVVDSALDAFSLNIELSQAVQQVALDAPPDPS